MKKTLPSEGSNRFSGGVKHYHRPNGGRQRTWDDWVDGDLPKRRTSSRNWLKVISITIGVLSLVGITVGLIIELS